MPKCVKIALVGCGAVAEMHYVPALRTLIDEGILSVAALVDPSPVRRAVLKGRLPQASELESLEKARDAGIDAAVVASPPAFHAQQTIALLGMGIHVLCEKPMATSSEEAEKMIAAARASDRVLAIGLFRRFFPSTEAIRDILRQGTLGRLESFEWSEGGVFNWPAASPSFFRRRESPGGVLADSGVHLLDVAISWLGEPDHLDYFDDRMGGLESNCRIEMTFPGGARGCMRLSRDTAVPNRLRMNFERGRVGLDGAMPSGLHIAFSGVGPSLKAELGSPTPSGTWVTGRDYGQSFCEQMRNFLAACRGEAKPRVPGEEGIRSIRVVERCYARRRLMAMPWLSADERKSAEALANA